MQTNIVLSGVVSSVVTELLKFIPFLRGTITTPLTSIVVTAIAVYVASGSITFVSFLTALGTAIATYLAAVQPIATAASSPTQN